MFQKIKTHFRLHKWYILAIVGLLGGVGLEEARMYKANRLLSDSKWLIVHTNDFFESSKRYDVPANSPARISADSFIIANLLLAHDKADSAQSAIHFKFFK